MAPSNETERCEVWEIWEDRYQTRSTILTSQLPVSRWHEQIGYLARSKALSVGASNAYFRSLGLPSLFENY